MKNLIKIALASVALAVIAGLIIRRASDLPQESESSAPAPATAPERLAVQGAQIDALYPEAKAAESGYRYIVLQEGAGEKPKSGALVTAHYTGWLLDEKKFDSSHDRGKPFDFVVGIGQVIPGWDRAFLDMRKGEKRKLIIPSDLAYGPSGRGPIPPNAVLVFEVDLIDFR